MQNALPKHRNECAMGFDFKDFKEFTIVRKINMCITILQVILWSPACLQLTR